MFDFGNDDKEKLRENMEQIKDMVEEGKETTGGKPADESDFEQEGFDQSGFEENPQSQGFDSSDTGDNSSFDSSPGDTVEHTDQQENTQSFESGQGMDNRSEPAEQQLKQELDEFEEKFGEEKPERKQRTEADDKGPDTPSPKQQRSKATKSGVKDSRDLSDLTDEVPSPPETKEIDVPEIDRGPLFLRQQKFLRAKQMIEDMLYLSDEMERTVNDLEAGIQEDQRIEREVREILKDFEDNRTSVEDIISPREE